MISATVKLHFQHYNEPGRMKFSSIEQSTGCCSPILRGFRVFIILIETPFYCSLALSLSLVYWTYPISLIFPALPTPILVLLHFWLLAFVLLSQHQFRGYVNFSHLKNTIKHRKKKVFSLCLLF